MLRIILPQLSVLFSNIKSSNRILYTYTNIVAKYMSEDHDFGPGLPKQEIKVKGFIRLNKEIKLINELEKINIVVEGIGEIKISSNNSSIIYFGRWIDSEVFVDKLISDIVIFSNNEIIFDGHPYNIHFVEEIISHVTIRANKFKINIPIVPGADLTLELMDGTQFLIVIDHAKPNDKFSLTEKLHVNSLVHKSICFDDTEGTEELYELGVIIERDNVTFMRNNLTKSANKAANFKYVHNLRGAPIEFLEKKFLRLPKNIKNIPEILTSLSEIMIRLEN